MKRRNLMNKHTIKYMALAFLTLVAHHAYAGDVGKLENNSIEQRLKDLGITLPVPTKPVGTYIPYVFAGNNIYLSGQGSKAVGEFKNITGKVGNQLDAKSGYQAARLSGLHLLANLLEACRVHNIDPTTLRCVSVTGYVNASPHFTSHPDVTNGVSKLFIDVFGQEKGSHTRTSLGVISLPSDYAVEASAIFFVDKQ
jgi:enamine deaminase RidA (YjgF/YER057c/UK114 family)